jgi:hypothetical protein
MRYQYMREYMRCGNLRPHRLPFADFLQLLLVAQLKSRRIVEDKTGIVLEYEQPIDIVYPSLIAKIKYE